MSHLYIRFILKRAVEIAIEQDEEAALRYFDAAV
jgi:hypothetical protein